MPQITGKEVGPIGFGMMGMTWRQDPPPVEQSFATMRKALELGANFFNGGELYGTPERNSLHLLNEYLTKYPEDADKIVLSIKGGLIPGQMLPGGDEQNVRRSIDECLRVLDGKCKLGIFECARVDPKVPIETTVKAIAQYVEEGKIGGVGLSEVSANTIRRASKVYPIAAVEVELSMWATDILENGIAATCGELNIPIIAYSPLGRGFLTGQIKTVDDVPPQVKIFPRFHPDVFGENLKLVTEVEKIASRKGCTPAQLAVAWVKYFSNKPGMPTIIPLPGATKAERIEENMKEVTITDEEFNEIGEVLKRMPVLGERYGGHAAAMMNG